MVRSHEEDRFNSMTTLSELCLNKLSRRLTLENCLDLYQFGDMYFNEELKINCLKFIMLNLVSFLSEGSKFAERLIGLPIYLVKDIENFLKERDIQKFLWLDMKHFEEDVDYEATRALPVSEQQEQLGSDFISESSLKPEKCMQLFSEICNMY